jgi:ABC-type Na+ efflux pump permease subunit
MIIPILMHNSGGYNGNSEGYFTVTFILLGIGLLILMISVFFMTLSVNNSNDWADRISNKLLQLASIPMVLAILVLLIGTIFNFIKGTL